MEPPGRGSHLFSNRGRERDHVVLRRLFDFFNAGDVEPRFGANFPCGLEWDQAGFGHGVGGSKLHLEPRLVSALLAPDGPHLRVRITANHRCRLLATAGWRLANSFSYPKSMRARSIAGTDGPSTVAA